MLFLIKIRILIQNKINFKLFTGLLIIYFSLCSEIFFSLLYFVGLLFKFNGNWGWSGVGGEYLKPSRFEFWDFLSPLGLFLSLAQTEAVWETIFLKQESEIYFLFCFFFFVLFFFLVLFLFFSFPCCRNSQQSYLGGFR